MNDTRGRDGAQDGRQPKDAEKPPRWDGSFMLAMVAGDGLEPPTRGFSILCSTRLSYPAMRRRTMVPAASHVGQGDLVRKEGGRATRPTSSHRLNGLASRRRPAFPLGCRRCLTHDDRHAITRLGGSALRRILIDDLPHIGSVIACLDPDPQTRVLECLRGRVLSSCRSPWGPSPSARPARPISSPWYQRQRSRRHRAIG